MSFERRGLGALVAGLLALFVQTTPATAGELERRFAEPVKASTMQVGNADLDLENDLAEDLVMSDLRLVEEFHPETDRWTERTNRIRISPWIGAWMFSDELRIHHDVALGFRIAWEVPGFIGIRLDSGFVPWSRMEVKLNGSSRWMDGIVHSHTLSIGIFNPELSIEGLAFWAGFGGGLWIYDYNESDVFGLDSGIDADFNDINISGNIFVELDYKILDILHVGMGARLHILYADHTNEGRFYSINGNDPSGGERNDGIVDDLATVTEFTFSVSVLF